MAACDFTISGTETTDWDWSADVPSVTTPPAGSMYFYGTDGHGQATYDSKLNISSDFTIAFFAKTTSNPGSVYLLSKYNGASDNNWSVLQGYTSNSYSFYSSVTGQQLATDFSDWAWHHYAYTFTGGTLELYVDGSSVGTVGSLGNLSTSTGDLFLADFSGNNSYNGLFYITNLFVWNTAKDATFVGGLAAGDVPSAASANLILRYLFSEGTGTTVADTSDYTPPAPPASNASPILLFSD